MNGDKIGENPIEVFLFSDSERGVFEVLLASNYRDSSFYVTAIYKETRVFSRANKYFDILSKVPPELVGYSPASETRNFSPFLLLNWLKENHGISFDYSSFYSSEIPSCYTVVKKGTIIFSQGFLSTPNIPLVSK